MKHDARAQPHQGAKHAIEHGGSSARAYWMFALNLALSLIPMYLAMFTMIDGRGDFRNNVNMLYMALTMLAPMGMIMLATMGSMYGNKPLNLALYAALAVLFVGSLWATRAQALVDDKQFVDSMIPHHSGAILMCREARLADPELVKLCGEIVKAQRAEISQMEAIAARLRAPK
ncbi:DUF305 domain-containing protein [Caenimonas sedimenti]|uniref:DUF305 domain-containing protein n=1 Tax=Caenimonas sedimenti TaxID=2596921 RepID=A0A562ZX12_9BURK|nr:DUF305 domain-containing protein [Caenimonas sedimenti]TWO73003.1 DUF305 domain-containing protein [Caenimonas sedimenti]